MKYEAPLRVFIGYDHRQPISLNVLQHSIYTKSSKPVAITPLVLDQLPIDRQGLTPFTFSRFLVPYLCGYKGWALFLDLDMILNADIAELFALADDKYAIMVSKNKKRFEWTSAMLMNCAKCPALTPEFVQTADGLHMLNWLDEKLIGDLPAEWNHLVGYDTPRADVKLIHYTQGIPAFPETSTSEHAEKWHKEHKAMNSATSWKDLMGNSVHAGKLNGVTVPKFVAEEAARVATD